MVVPACSRVNMCGVWCMGARGPNHCEAYEGGRGLKMHCFASIIKVLSIHIVKLFKIIVMFTMIC